MTTIDQLPKLPELYEVPEDPEARAAWTISSEGEFLWAMQKIAEAAERRNEVEALATPMIKRLQAEIDQVQDWVREQCAEPDRADAFFSHHVTRWALRQREQSGGKTKSVTAPHGTVKTVVGRESWQVDDEPALLAYLLEYRPELVKTEVKQTAPKADLKKALEAGPDGDVFDPKAQGEQVPGVRVVVGEMTAKVELKLPAAEPRW